MDRERERTKAKAGKTWVSSFQRTLLVKALLFTGSENSAEACSTVDIVTVVDKRRVSRVYGGGRLSL